MARTKHFHEAGAHAHYDARFFKGEPDRGVQHRILTGLLAEFVRFAFANGTRPILMHGGLIGWYWNRRLLPWDDDLDISLLYGDLEALSTASDYDSDSYLFEINPHYKVRRSENRHYGQNAEPNRIDARFIDKESGSFIDITALSTFGPAYLHTKCPHFYRREHLLPLRQDSFEDLTIYVPNRPEEVLIQEYGAASINNPTYGGYWFNPDAGLWEPHAGL